MRRRDGSGLVLLAIITAAIVAGLFFTMRSGKHATRVPDSAPAAHPSPAMMGGGQ